MPLIGGAVAEALAATAEALQFTAGPGPVHARRPGPDAYVDLVALLEGRSSSASIDSLRRHRFPAGLLARAQRDGVVRVDRLEGTVDTAATAAERPPGSARSAHGA